MISVKITKELEEKLDRVAKNSEKPKSYFVNEALEQYLDDYDESDEFDELDDEPSYVPNKHLTNKHAKNKKEKEKEK